MAQKKPAMNLMSLLTGYMQGNQGMNQYRNQLAQQDFENQLRLAALAPKPEPPGIPMDIQAKALGIIQRAKTDPEYAKNLGNDQEALMILAQAQQVKTVAGLDVPKAPKTPGPIELKPVNRNTAGFFNPQTGETTENPLYDPTKAGGGSGGSRYRQGPDGVIYDTWNKDAEGNLKAVTPERKGDTEAERRKWVTIFQEGGMVPVEEAIAKADSMIASTKLKEEEAKNKSGAKASPEAVGISTSGGKMQAVWVPDVGQFVEFPADWTIDQINEEIVKQGGKPLGMPFKMGLPEGQSSSEKSESPLKKIGRTLYEDAVKVGRMIP